MPVRPACHGTLYLRSESQLGEPRLSIRLASTLGRLALSSSCIHPSAIIRPAVESVIVMMSRPIGSQAPSWSFTLPKNSTLSLMSVL